jgi:hypothetical protein
MVDTDTPRHQRAPLPVSREWANNGEQAFSGEYKTGFDIIVVQVLGRSDSNDHRIPGFAESEQAHAQHQRVKVSTIDFTQRRGWVWCVVEKPQEQRITLEPAISFDAGHGSSTEHLSSVYGTAMQYGYTRMKHI